MKSNIIFYHLLFVLVFEEIFVYHKVAEIFCYILSDVLIYVYTHETITMIKIVNIPIASKILHAFLYSIAFAPPETHILVHRQPIICILIQINLHFLDIYIMELYSKYFLKFILL